MPELHWTEVDGVTTVWADTRRPLTAGLLFRAGRADETLATAGHTHLIEHLALSSLPGNPERQAGSVGGASTVFGTTGSPQEVSAFLVGVSRALGFLPGERLESEKQILGAENAARPYNFYGNLLVWRYGAAGYGLTGLAELGLRGATMPQLQALAGQRFTSENAVLWLSGPPPAGLCFELPHGVKLPAPRPMPILPEFPAWVVDDHSGGVAASAVVPRARAVSPFRLIAARRMYEGLRTKRAVSYAPSVSYEPLDADTAHLVLYADSDLERRAEAADAFCEVFERLADISDAEVEGVCKELVDQWIGPLAPPVEDMALAELQGAAMNWIFGREHESFESLAAEVTAVTAAEVSAFARDVQSGALFALPGKAKLRPMTGKAAPACVVPAVEGRQILSQDAPLNGARLVHGTDGLTLRQPDGAQLTVRYTELGAALCYDDGCVTLIGADAMHLIVEPTLWRDGVRICREIRERVPAQLLLDQGARPADAIPKPTTTRWQRLRARLANLAKRPAPRDKLFAFIVAAILLFSVAVIPQAPDTLWALMFLYLIFLFGWALPSGKTG